ncbi:MAG: energy transducer TonB [Caldimicrobium sp.]|nr:energy transducer TonB [Caldimicrobium sp.]
MKVKPASFSLFVNMTMALIMFALLSFKGQNFSPVLVELRMEKEESPPLKTKDKSPFKSERVLSEPVKSDAPPLIDQPLELKSETTPIRDNRIEEASNKLVVQEMPQQTAFIQTEAAFPSEQGNIKGREGIEKVITKWREGEGMGKEVGARGGEGIVTSAILRKEVDSYGEVYQRDYERRNWAMIRELVANFLEYPPIAILRGWEGKVMLKLCIEGKHLCGVEIRESSGYPLLDESALRAAKRVNGKLPQAEHRVYLLLPIKYELKGVR